MTAFTGNTVIGTKRLPLAVVCVAQFVVVLDATIVTTALPVVRAALGFASADLSWVITAYTLTFGGFLVAGGRIADVLGARRTFGVGLTVFVAASAACALSTSPGMLIGVRAAQGVGAALLSPAALSLLMTIAGDGPIRHRAVGWWTAAAAGGGASGWVLGGLLTEYLGWRTVFWVNVPLGAMALFVAARVLPSGSPRHSARLDILGAVMVTGALGLSVYGLSRVGEDGSAAVVPLLGGVALFLLFCRRLRRVSDPLVPPRLLRSRPVAGANLAALGLTAATTPAMYLATLYVQQVLGYSVARASLLFPAFNLAVIGGSLAGPTMLRRFGDRRVTFTGFAGVAAGAVLLAVLPGTGAPVGQLLASFAVMGAGLGLAAVASTHAGTEAAAAVDRGVASGLLSSAAQIGTSFGLAVLTPIAASAGYRVGFLGALAFAIAGLATGLLLRRCRPTD